MELIKVDVAVIGGSMGGIAAAQALLEAGYTVAMSEEYSWLGGQVTSQLVPPDENPWIESVGGTTRYQNWRNKVRRYYHNNYPLHNSILDKPLEEFNPGGGFVSRLCHEPRISARIFDEMLQPYETLGRLKLFKGWTAGMIHRSGRRIQSVDLYSETSDSTVRIVADYYLDATDLGDLLPLAEMEFVTGAEARSDTGELHAAEQADPKDDQAITWCMAISRDKIGSDHRIEKPVNYDRHKQHLSPFWPGSQLQWLYSHPITLETIRASIENGTEHRDLWNYRKIFTPNVLSDEYRDAEEITVVNWPQNDYWFNSVIDTSPQERRQYYDEARELSLSFLYWMQTEAPHDDGKGKGYPELRLRPDITGTSDGLAMAPYIRESRRIKSLYRVTEASIGFEMRYKQLSQQAGVAVEKVQAEEYSDSVGIGYYRIDLHPSTGGKNYIDISSLPFQIPLGALIPQDCDNLLPACKNLGVTHISNGCYRLHPVEWNIGESAGELAAYCMAKKTTPKEVYENEHILQNFKSRLRLQGIRLEWPRDIAEVTVADWD